MDGIALSKRAWTAIGLVLLAVALVGFAVDLKNTRKYGQIDLRNRVVGARLMLEGKDPYTYQWKEGDSPRLLDPVSSPTSPITKTTVTPAVLAFHASFSGLGYREQKFLWLVLEWLFFAVIVVAALTLTSDALVRMAILGTGLAFFASAFWRQHVDVGQIPILYGSLAAVVIALLRRRGRWSDLAGGVLLGILVSFRPQFVFLGLPLLIYFRGLNVVGAGIGLALGVGVPTALSPQVWIQYARAIGEYLQPTVTGAKTLPEPAIPEIIEGLKNITTHGSFSDLDSSAFGVLKLFHVRLPSGLLFAAIGVAAVWWGWRMVRAKAAGAPVEFAAAQMLGMVLLADLLLPIRRLPYSDALLVATTVMLVAAGGRSFIASTRNLFLIFLALIFALELRWIFMSGLVPPLAILALAICAKWKE